MASKFGMWSNDPAVDEDVYVLDQLTARASLTGTYNLLFILMVLLDEVHKDQVMNLKRLSSERSNGSLRGKLFQALRFITLTFYVRK